MGQKPFPDNEKLQFIINLMIEGKSDSYIQGKLDKTPFPEKNSSDNPLVRGRIGDKTLQHIRSVYRITNDLLSPLFERINDPAVQKALAEHLEEVRRLIEEWRDTLQTPEIYEVYPGTLRPSKEIESRSLFSCLKGHIPFTELWDSYSQYVVAFDAYLTSVRAVEEAAFTAIRKWAAVEEVSESAIRPILRAIQDSITPGQPYKHIIPMGNGPWVGQSWLVVDGYKVLLTGCRDEIKVKYEEYSKKVEASPSAKSLRDRYALTIKFQEKARACLEEVLLSRDYLANYCASCINFGKPRDVLTHTG